MIADKLAESVEKQLIRDLLRQDDCPWTDAEIAGLIKNFAARVKDGGLESTLNKVCSAAQELQLDRLREIFEKCIQIAKVDGDFTKRETRMLNRIQELLPELRLQLIAEHHPEAATLRDSRASWQHRVRSSEDSGTNAASKIVSLFFGVLFVIALVATSIQKKDFETKFARIKAGLMTDTEVVELLGRPDKQTRTKMIWGDLYPRYNDEHRYTVNLSDGIVTSTDVERGTESRGY